jgi:membrane protein DedA with SNARE-associated domain
VAGILHSLLAWISQYGYVAVFGLLMLGIVGLPVPDETLLVFSGYLISRGRFNPFFAFAAGFLGSACGISLSYIIGRSLGRRAVIRYGKHIGITAARLDRTHAWFEKTGEWLLAFGYFIPGVRHLTALVAGTSDLNFRVFAIFAWSGAAFWVASFLTLGYFVGENWQQTIDFVEHYTLLAVVLAVVFAAAVYWLRRKFLTP